MSGNWVGKTLGKVQIESLIARGGMAEVYLGTHITLDRKVAVKILRNPSEEHSDALERFQREARVIASLRHPNIIQVFDFDTVDNDPYIVMEYVEGPSLSAYLHFLHKNNKTLPLPHIARMLGSVASALQHAHNNKIIHRDIKPGNILLASHSGQIELNKPLPDDFEPVLTDFGLIRFLDTARQTTSGVTAGTPAYMSPEQAQGETTDGLTDIYSLGIVLYEMLAGKLPFDGETTVSILLKHVNEPPSPIPGLSPFMQEVLDKALAKKREDRFQSPMEFANAFSAAVDINPSTMQMEVIPGAGNSTTQVNSLAETKLQNKPEQSKRSGWTRIAITGILALMLGGFLFFNKLPLSTSATGTATTTNTSMVLPPTITSTDTRTATPVPINLETRLVIHFHDENAIADQAFLEAYRVPAPPEGNNFEVWLFNSKERISLGILSVDVEGKGELSYTDAQGTNLIAKFDRAEITLEPQEDTNPSPTKLVVYSFALPTDGTENIRFLLSSFPAAPDQVALIQGMYIDIQKIDELAREMDAAHGSGNVARVHQLAENIMNMIVGAQSPNYKDWDNNGNITDDGSGYGLLLNGSNPGYFGAIYSETDNAVNLSDASQPMTTNGEYLKNSLQNLAQLTSQLQETVTAILKSPSDVKEQIANAVTFADQMLNGLDLDGNGSIEPATEGGAQAAYMYSYGMADMPLEPTGLIAGIGTSTPPGGIYQPTTSSNGSNGGSSSGGGGSGEGVSPTQHVPPGQVKTKKPTNTPRPKKNNNGNNGNNP